MLNIRYPQLKLHCPPPPPKKKHRWNPAAEMQAIDRTHRLGQYRPIRAVRFIAEGTVEERVLQLQEKKRLVFDGTVGRYVIRIVQTFSPLFSASNLISSCSQRCRLPENADCRGYESHVRVK